MSSVFTVKIRCDSDAFCDDTGTSSPESAAPELAHILREIADQIEAGAPFGWYQTILDRNGNDVGRYAMKAEG